MSPPGRPYLRHWWTSARKPSRQHPPTLFSPAPSCAGVCSNGFDSLNRQHRLQPRPRLDEVAQGITLKHLDEGIARVPRLCATHNKAKSRKGVDGLETRRDGHVRLCTAYNLTELNCLSRVCETQAAMLPPIAADPDMLPDSAWLLLSMI